MFRDLISAVCYVTRNFFLGLVYFFKEVFCLFKEDWRSDWLLAWEFRHVVAVVELGIYRFFVAESKSESVIVGIVEQSLFGPTQDPGPRIG